MLVRVPIVPGFTDAAGDLADIADAVAGARLARVELMPYHELGRDKYDGLGRSYDVATSPPHALRESIDRARDIFERRSIVASVSGE